MMATPVNTDSHNILSLIKPDTIGAEIGVWMGSTSEKLVKCKPKKLYLVDAWSTGPYIAAAKENNVSLDAYYDKYKKMCGGDAAAYSREVGV